MNPFNEKCKTLDKNFIPMKKMYPKSYNKERTSPYTKTRVILMNGTEFESAWFMHQFARHCDNPEILSALATVRRQEQQQQKRISCLKPLNESILETTIGYEQLAVDLTATLARNEKDENNIKALNFALLEDFDHLYRYANLLKMDKGIDADTLVGKMTEIMPGRPTIAEHRHPADDLKPHMDGDKADLYSKLVASTITAAEQQMPVFCLIIHLFSHPSAACSIHFFNSSTPSPVWLEKGIKGILSRKPSSVSNAFMRSARWVGFILSLLVRATTKRNAPCRRNSSICRSNAVAG